MTLSAGLVAGIDAGGSKTRAFAVTRDGAIVGRGAGAGANLLASPDPKGSIAAALAEALAGRTPDAVVLSCAGGDREADRRRGTQILESILGPSVRTLVTHDAQAALYAGNPQGCGVVLIAGTGSVAYGRTEEGDEARAGGWGFLAGDEGSAVWVGMEGLRAASHAADGRGSPTRILPLLLRELGVDDWQGVLPHVYGRPHPPPGVMAANRAVAMAASESDAIAVRIVERGAHDLARAVQVVALGLAMAEGPVYLAGGMFENVSLLEHAVRRELLGMLPRAAVEKVREEPAMGAARIAAQLAWAP
ncbi:MAG TPA: BadF/BadG/BcrA/BcrD ATPase family protein [Candidatus Limnocylindria bacterium]|nr:BadF/BadG/BcrA/BcrD ATPase family protein [Candidatus Limnocylindria bacterium]